MNWAAKRSFPSARCCGSGARTASKARSSPPARCGSTASRRSLLHLDCDASDVPHVVALFRRGGSWGAISKTNGAVLRYRDPVYRSLRELALSYFHEYCNKRGQKTLRSYSAAFDLRRVDPEQWVTRGAACQEAHDRLAALRHYPLISRRQEKLLTRRDAFEREAGRACNIRGRRSRILPAPRAPVPAGVANLRAPCDARPRRTTRASAFGRRPVRHAAPADRAGAAHRGCARRAGP